MDLLSGRIQTGQTVTAEVEGDHLRFDVK
jgi:hypothetical protein